MELLFLLVSQHICNYYITKELLLQDQGLEWVHFIFCRKEGGGKIQEKGKRQDSEEVLAWRSLVGYACGNNHLNEE